MAATALIDELQSDERQTSKAALSILADTVANSFGMDAAALASALRQSGSMHVLVASMGDADPEVQSCAVSMVGNLLSSSFDANARQSLDLFAQAGGLPVLQAKLTAEWPINVTS